MDHGHGHFLLLPEGTTIDPIQKRVEQILSFCGWTDIPNRRVETATVFTENNRIAGIHPYVHMGMITDGDPRSLTYIQISTDHGVESQLLRRVIADEVYPEREYWHWRDIVLNSSNVERIGQIQQGVIKFRNQNRLIRQGYNLTFDDVFSYAADKPYDTILEEHILTACKEMVRRTDDASERRNFLIIDDGGKAIKLVQDSFTTQARFVGVEQTSRGARLLAPLAVSFPVINVARSKAKTIHESPVIAEAMVRELLLSLDRWDADDVFHLPEKRALLLGYGYIGERVAKKLLDHGFRVVVYDTDGNKAAQAAQHPDISTVSNRTLAYPDASLIVGCTGMPSTPDEEFKLIKPGSLLANMASSDTEFSAWYWRRKDAIVHTSVLPSDEHYLTRYFPLPWRSLYRCHVGDTHFYLANGGFPMDFSGSVNPIPADSIQLTAALLMAAAVQAVQSQEAGLIPLRPDIQEGIVAQYLKTHL